MYLGSAAIEKPPEQLRSHANRGVTSKNTLTLDEKKKKRLMVKESKRKNRNQK